MDAPFWSLSEHATNTADLIYREELAIISVEGYNYGVLLEPGQEQVVVTRALRELYADSLFDLSRLLEEIRFEVAFATMLTSDFRFRNPLPDPNPDSALPAMALSMEILAVLSSYAAAPPSPSLLAKHLHSPMSGGRHLSRWLAGQLLDSAMLRSLSVLDRVTTLLRIRAGLGIHTRSDGSYRLPSFNKHELKALSATYAANSAWAPLKAVCSGELFQFIKRYRDGAVHQRRWPSELHGESTVTYWDPGAPREDGEPVEYQSQGMSASDHIGLNLATWKLVLRPAVEAGGALISTPQDSA